MKMEKKYPKLFGIVALLLSCLILTSCGYTWASNQNVNMMQIYVGENLDSTQTIEPDRLRNVFYYDDDLRERPMFFPGNGIVKIETERYVVLPGFDRHIVAAQFEQYIYIYDVDDGVIAEGTVVVGLDSNFWRIIYDETDERVLWTRHRRDVQRGFQREPDELIVLSPELEELWRMNIPHYARSFEVLDDLLKEPDHIPFYIMDVAITEDYYYVVSINNIRSGGGSVLSKVEAVPSSDAITVVYRVDRDGNVLDIFRRANFEFLGIIIQDGFYVIYGIQTSGRNAETVVIYGCSESIFSEQYTIIQSKNIIFNVMIENDTLLISGGLWRGTRINEFITLIDLNERNIIKTLDVSEIGSTYNMHIYGVFYGANKDQIGIIGTLGLNSKLNQGRNSVVFIPITDELEISKIVIIDIGYFFQSDILDISVTETYLNILCRSRERVGEYHSWQHIIDFSISHEQLMSLQ